MLFGKGKACCEIAALEALARGPVRRMTQVVTALPIADWVQPHRLDIYRPQRRGANIFHRLAQDMVESSGRWGLPIRSSEGDDAWNEAGFMFC